MGWNRSGCVGRWFRCRCDRRPSDHGFGHSRVAFVVARQAAVRGQPGEGALHGPPARDHREALLACGLAHDVNGGAQDLGGPVEQSPCEPAVGEHEPHWRAQVGVEQHRLGAVTVLHGGGQYDDDQQQPEGVGDDEPLAAVDLLPRVVAAGLPPDGVGTLDALGVDQSGAGQRVAPSCTRSWARTTGRMFSVTRACSHWLKYPYTLCHGGKSAGS